MQFAIAEQNPFPCEVPGSFIQSAVWKYSRISVGVCSGNESSLHPWKRRRVREATKLIASRSSSTNPQLQSTVFSRCIPLRCELHESTLVPTAVAGPNYSMLGYP